MTREEIRDLAVKLVDARRGYTADYAANPESHRQRYEDMEFTLEDLSPRQRDYYVLLYRGGETDQAALMNHFNASQRTASNVLGRLMDRGLVTFRRGRPEDRLMPDGTPARWEGPGDWLWRCVEDKRGSRRGAPVRNFALNAAGIYESGGGS